MNTNSKSEMLDSWQKSHIYGSNLHYIEPLYEDYLQNPNSVPEQWRDYFDKLPSNSIKKDIPLEPVREQFLNLNSIKRKNQTQSTTNLQNNQNNKQAKVLMLITAYRLRGHQIAKLDPLNLHKNINASDLDYRYHGLEDSDLNTEFYVGSLHIGKQNATLQEILDLLQATYTNSLGLEILHISNTDERRWIENRFEAVRGVPNYSDEVKKRILERLTAAEGLENYLASRYPGVKRFGLEGGESYIPFLNEVIQRAGSYGVKEIVIGMPHRGRLNTLINILGKSSADLFDEFDGRKIMKRGSGDVKYHQGYSSNIVTPGGELHLALAFNPSHLEIAAPVVEGSVRARQDRRKDDNGDLVLPIVVHGDAAIAGQGVVMETLQMSQTRAYKTGGTIHIVINNQVGFTTSNPLDARSSQYCTDIAKMIEAPVFHVNGDDPEAVLYVAQVAIDYRMQFKRDVMIDIVCYRRRGHNEADEPSGTQPLMYKVIGNLPTTRTLYANHLIETGVITKAEDETMISDYRNSLDKGEHMVNSLAKEPDKALFVDWSPYLEQEWTDYAQTNISMELLKEAGKQVFSFPTGFKLQRQVAKIYQDRQKMLAGGMPLNWGFAEIMAYASLLHQGYEVRLTGQDCGRGTFSHRHAVLHDFETAEEFVPLQNLFADQPRMTIYDSYLSEEAVLGFEYGYASTTPNSLVIWEAQFGDFANGAQVVIDQFITAGEIKWGRLCGLVMLLPHGFEGQGPEHSSARLERYLQLSAEKNMQVVVPTTPSQIFHLLRRQVIRPIRKPLIIMSPKSLLRHKDAISSLEDLTQGRFETLLIDAPKDRSKVERVIMMSGKLFYDIANKVKDLELENSVALIRVEQLYPFPDEDLAAALKSFENAKTFVWAQEEPLNKGAWYHTRHRLTRALENSHPEFATQLCTSSRARAASPASGYASVHAKEQEEVVTKACTMVFSAKK